MEELLCRYKDTFPDDYEFIYLDTEASALDDGYPIEVAWVSENNDSDSFLIKPCSYWLDCKTWHSQAESVHKINMNRLFLKGIDIIDAAHRLNKRLRGKIVLCDALAYDGEWLVELHETAGVEPEYQLTDIRYWYATLSKKSAGKFRDILLFNNSKKLHRALSDAKAYADTFTEWKQEQHEVATV